MANVSIVESSLLSLRGDVLANSPCVGCFIPALVLSPNDKVVYFSQQTGSNESVVRRARRRAVLSSPPSSSSSSSSSSAQSSSSWYELADLTSWKGGGHWVTALETLDENQTIVASVKDGDRIWKVKVNAGVDFADARSDFITNITSPSFGMVMHPRRPILFASVPPSRLLKIPLPLPGGPTEEGDLPLEQPEEESLLLAGGNVTGFHSALNGSDVRFDQPRISSRSISSNGSYLYVADTQNKVVSRVNTETGATTTVVFTQFANSTPYLPLATALTSDDCNLFVAGTVVADLTVTVRLVSFSAPNGRPLTATGRPVATVNDPSAQTATGSTSQTLGMTVSVAPRLVLSRMDEYLYLSTGNGHIFEFEVNRSDLYRCSSTDPADPPGFIRNFSYYSADRDISPASSGSGPPPSQPPSSSSGGEILSAPSTRRGPSSPESPPSSSSSIPTTTGGKQRFKTVHVVAVAILGSAVVVLVLALLVVAVRRSRWCERDRDGPEQPLTPHAQLLHHHSREPPLLGTRMAAARQLFSPRAPARPSAAAAAAAYPRFPGRKWSIENSSAANYDAHIALEGGGGSKKRRVMIKVFEANLLDITVQQQFVHNVGLLGQICDEPAPAPVGSSPQVGGGGGGVMACICKPLGYSIDGSKAIIIQQFFPCGNFLERLVPDTRADHDSPPVFEWSSRLYAVQQIAGALRRLHGLSPPVHHGNIKSSNVFIEGPGYPYLRVYLTDARLSRPTRAGMLVDEGGYLAPECSFERDLTTRSDVFAFGVLLFQIVCGAAAMVDLQEMDPRSGSGSGLGWGSWSATADKSLWYDAAARGRGAPRERGRLISLVKYARRQMESRRRVSERTADMVDPRLRRRLTEEERAKLTEVMKLAYTCTDEKPARRMSIADVYETLCRELPPSESLVSTAI
ncbi:hypothetical protein CBR_g16860 [Chara braunii]|uniref:Protein kinase domain-containing protein n=1 Tax=Chara braunii TaxID=69332 RepID=A0A388KTY8_CHABU|nr:hypothetical protein CBR_g16860 [Chara braunii]|eukprot:GBG73517.1 hypothetical protein CBR_g16860 [Chara braunii]